MASQGTKAMIRGRSVVRKGHRRSTRSRKSLAAKRARVKSSRALVQARRAPRISRARLRMIREHLDGTRNNVTDTVQHFWTNRRETFAKRLRGRNRRSGRAVDD
jgi:hypothetical protein